MKQTIVKNLIEKIEGEAELSFRFKSGIIEDVQIDFGFYRGIEEILIGRAGWDAMVITPRVCGICNHAHLLVAVEAIENGYAQAGLPVTLSPKARKIRWITLASELIQNHIKWLYLTILPMLERLNNTSSGENYPLKANYLATTMTKVIALFAGQWPHSAYAIPGGITCDPTQLEVLQARTWVEEAIRFFEQVVSGMELEAYLTMTSVAQLHTLGGDLAHMLYQIGEGGMAQLGQSYDRFLVLSETPLSPAGKSLATVVSAVDPRYVQEGPRIDRAARTLTYKNRLYEVGPLARGMVGRSPLIRSFHKRYKDGLMSRIFARVHETALLLDSVHTTLKQLRLDEPSNTLEGVTLPETYQGIGVVEAARGSLIHTTSVHEGTIRDYQIMVPTQWNLSRGDHHSRGVAAEAMHGMSDTDKAGLVFRAFDVCSVCTIQ